MLWEIEGSPVVALVFLRQRDEDTSSTLGRGQLMIFWAVFMILCSASLSSAVEPAYHTPRQYVSTFPQRSDRRPDAALCPGCSF